MEKATWSVVQFSDSTVEAVPSNWIHQGSCYWPTVPHAQVMMFIKNCEPVNPKWPKRGVKVFKNSTFDDYTRACSEARLAEGTSDLQTESKETGNRRKRKALFGSDDELSESTLSTPPKTNSHTNNGNISVLEGFVPETDETNTSSHKISHKEMEQSMATGTIQGDCPKCKEGNKMLETLVTQCNLMQSMLCDIMAGMASLQGQVTSLGHKPVASSKTSIFTKIPTVTFPLDNEEHVEELENALKDENCFDDAVNELAATGGKHNYNCVRRIMSALISNDLALQYSWLGRKGKKTFNTLSIAKLIILAVEKAKLSNNREETETSIQLWLRRASDRKASATKNILSKTI